MHVKWTALALVDDGWRMQKAAPSSASTVGCGGGPWAAGSWTWLGWLLICVSA